MFDIQQMEALLNYVRHSTNGGIIKLCSTFNKTSLNFWRETLEKRIPLNGYTAVGFDLVLVSYEM